LRISGQGSRPPTPKTASPGSQRRRRTRPERNSRPRASLSLRGAPAICAVRRRGKTLAGRPGAEQPASLPQRSPAPKGRRKFGRERPRAKRADPIQVVAVVGEALAGTVRRLRRAPWETARTGVFRTSSSPRRAAARNERGAPHESERERGARSGVLAVVAHGERANVRTGSFRRLLSRSSDERERRGPSAARETPSVGTFLPIGSTSQVSQTIICDVSFCPLKTVPQMVANGRKSDRQARNREVKQAGVPRRRALTHTHSPAGAGRSHGRRGRRGGDPLARPFRRAEGERKPHPGSPSPPPCVQTDVIPVNAAIGRARNGQHGAHMRGRDGRHRFQVCVRTSLRGSEGDDACFPKRHAYPTRVNEPSALLLCSIRNVGHVCSVHF